MRLLFLILIAASAGAQTSGTVSELKTRRQSIMDKIGPTGVLLLFAAEGRVYAADVEYPYRQENNFLYLTGLQEEGAVLALLPGGTRDRELLFLPSKERRAEVFTGSVIKPAAATTTSGIERVLPLAELPVLLATLAPQSVSALVSLGPAAKLEKPRTDAWQEQYKPLFDAAATEQAQLYLVLPGTVQSAEYRQEQALASNVASIGSGFTVHDAVPLLRDMRLLKSPYELAAIQRAIDISGEGFAKAFALTRPGVAEGDIQAEFDRVYAHHHARWGYPTIAASGANGTTLHYNSNSGEMPAQGTMVLDAGAEYAQYSADITRTLPITGKFTPEQASLYRIVYQAQQAGIAAARAGAEPGTAAKFSPESLQGVCVDIVRRGLFRLGLITSVTNDEYKNWFPHGVSHQLGMNVHDLSRRDVRLAPGMVVTMEPGIYIRPDALDALPNTPENEKFKEAVRPVFEKCKGIGVRIEDDILITNGAAKVLSAAIPSKLEDVEATMAQARTGKSTGAPER